MGCVISLRNMLHIRSFALTQFQSWSLCLIGKHFKLTIETWKFTELLNL